MIAAVVFDMDGVLLDSELAWDAAREAYTRDQGGVWAGSAQRDMMGMSSTEWSRYMHEALGVPVPPEQIARDVVERMLRSYREELPLVPGAVEAVERIAARWPLGLASSANRPLIDMALAESALDRHFRATVSSEEVARGKPAPDVYLEAARRLGVDPGDCAAVEDSHNGILAAHAAGMRTVAIPNRAFPPGPVALARAHLVLDRIGDLRPEGIAAADARYS
jgi:HAD superfamily hydrolase (TIGR01509 family)